MSAASYLAQCSRQTPRVANRLLRRVRDFAQYHNQAIITEKIAKQALESLGVDELDWMEWTGKFCKL